MPLNSGVGKHRDVTRAFGTSTITGGTLLYLLTLEEGRIEAIHQFLADASEAVAKTALEAVTATSVASQANGCIRAFSHYWYPQGSNIFQRLSMLEDGSQETVNIALRQRLCYCASRKG